MSVPPVRQVSVHVQPVNAMILVSEDVARLIVHWLGQHAKGCQQRYGGAPAGLVEVQQSLTEAVTSCSLPRECISPGDSGIGSRRREIVGGFIDVDLPWGHERFVSPSDAAALLGITADAVRWRCRSGRLPHRKDGRRMLIPVSALSAPRDERGPTNG